MNLTFADISSIIFVSSATVGGEITIATFDPKALYTDGTGALYVQCHPMSHWNLLFSVYQKDGLRKGSDVPGTTAISSIVFPYIDSGNQPCSATLTLVTGNYTTATKILTVRVNVLYEKVLNLSSPQNDVDGTYHVDNRHYLVLNSDSNYHSMNMTTVISQQTFDGTKIVSGAVSGCKIALN